MPEEELSPSEEKYFETGGEEPLDDTPVEETGAEEASEAEAPAEAPPEETEAPAEEAEPDEPRTVPLQALHEAREEAKKLRDRLEAKDADFNKLEGRLDVLHQMAQREAEQPDVPTWEETPIDAGKMTTERVQALEQEIATQRNQQQLSQAVTSQEAAFRTQTPDYDQALAHLQTARVKELEVFGLDQQAIQSQLRTEAEQLAVTALQNGMNPAEIVYKLAQTRGYAKTEDAKPAAAAPDHAKQLDAIERGQQAAVSAAATPGTPPPKNTLETILDMDDDEFSDVADRDWKRIWG